MLLLFEYLQSKLKLFIELKSIVRIHHSHMITRTFNYA